MIKQMTKAEAEVAATNIRAAYHESMKPVHGYAVAKPVPGTDKYGVRISNCVMSGWLQDDDTVSMDDFVTSTAEETADKLGV